MGGACQTPLHNCDRAIAYIYIFKIKPVDTPHTHITSDVPIPIKKNCGFWMQLRNKSTEYIGGGGGMVHTAGD